MKINVYGTESYCTLVVREPIEIDTDNYPELEGMSEEEQRVALKRIKYVHELENLFFVLTGEELNVNLETVGSSCS